MSESEGLEQDLDTLLQAFITKWNLQVDSQQLLLSMDPELQAKVLRDFSPRDTARDVNSIFCKFAQGVASRTPQKSWSSEASAALPQVDGDEGLAILEFVDKWQLNDDAQTLLYQMDPAARSKAMKDFNPRDTSRDVNPIFMKFAQGIGKGAPRASKGGGKGAFGAAPQVTVEDSEVFLRFAATNPGAAQQAVVTVHMSPMGPRLVVRPAQRASGGRPAAMMSGQRPSPAVGAFVSKWGLSGESQSLLLSMDHSVQQKVMTEFAPRDTSRDANGIFWKFAQGIAAREQGGGGGTTRTFVAQWGLGQDAQAVLHQMRPEVQHRIMQEFRPRDASSDVNNVFMKFAQSVNRTMGGGGFQAGNARPAGGCGVRPPPPRFSPY